MRVALLGVLIAAIALVIPSCDSDPCPGVAFQAPESATGRDLATSCAPSFELAGVEYVDMCSPVRWALLGDMVGIATVGGETALRSIRGIDADQAVAVGNVRAPTNPREGAGHGGRCGVWHFAAADSIDLKTMHRMALEVKLRAPSPME